MTWVDKEILGEIADRVLQLSMVGIDAEFCRADYSPLSQNTLATLHIASDNKVFIFDCLALAKEAIFRDFLTKLFAQGSIMKAGHSFNCDLEVIEQSLNCKIKEINNLLDFGCDPQTKKRVSLAKLVE